MDIQAGRYHLRSDQFCMWIEEEYETKDGKGRPKTARRRVAGYAPNMTLLMRQFLRHRYMSSDAESMRELLKVLSQTMTDMEELNSKAVKEDFKIVRKVMKERGIK